MFESLENVYRRARDTHLLSLLRQPGVIANYLLHRRQANRRPLLMSTHPPAIEIELTNRCNLACIQCLRSRGLKPYALGDITHENFRRILAQFPHVTNLGLNGFGEPLMHEGFFEIVAHARRERPWVKLVIYSNGMLLDHPRAERLPGSGLTEVNVSIDASRPETYRRVRRGGHLETVHAGIRRLLRARTSGGGRFPRVGTNFVMLDANEGELVPFIEQSAELGVDHVNCVTYATYDWGIENRRSPDSYRREVDAARTRLQALGLPARSLPSDDLSWSDPARPFQCGFFWGESLRVTHTGEVTLGCCTPFKETYSYGNLLESSFDEIWNGPRFRHNRALAARHEAPTPACASCDRFAKSFFTPRAAGGSTAGPGKRLRIHT